MNNRESRRTRTFLCRDDLFGAFEARARQLECSVDWLLAEAMKRLLADAALAPKPPPSNVPPPPGVRVARVTPPPRRGTGLAVVPAAAPPPPPAPPPQPPPPFGGARAGAIAIRSGDERVVVDR